VPGYQRLSTKLPYVGPG